MTSADNSTKRLRIERVGWILSILVTGFFMFAIGYQISLDQQAKSNEIMSNITISKISDGFNSTSNECADGYYTHFGSGGFYGCSKLPQTGDHENTCMIMNDTNTNVIKTDCSVDVLQHWLDKRSNK